MVNTFLPWPDEKKSAQALDNKRLGKQRVEGLQILRANLGLTKGWRNHPAAVMWRNHEGALAQYICAMCDEWEARGYVDNVRAQVLELWKTNNFPNESFTKPWWWGKKQIHRSHKSNLKRKDPDYYRFKVPDDLPYEWPTQTHTFRTVEKKTKKGE